MLGTETCRGLTACVAALCGLVIAIPSARAEESLVATSPSGAVQVQLQPTNQKLLVRQADAWAEVKLEGLAEVTAAFPTDGGECIFLTACDGRRAVRVVDVSRRSVRDVPMSSFFGLLERAGIDASSWCREAGTFVLPRGDALFVDTVGGLKVVERDGRVRGPVAGELEGARASLQGIPRLTAVRGLAALGERRAVAGELDGLLAHLVERPHEDRSLSEAVSRTVRESFASDDRLADDRVLLQLLEVYRRFDRTFVRELLSDGPGREAIRPLRDIMDDEDAALSIRIAAASCVMALSTFRRSEAFLFALEGLDAATEDARQESFAVLAWFAGVELLRYRSDVERKVLGALAMPDGRSDHAELLLHKGLGGTRSHPFVLPVVLEQLARPDLPTNARRAVYRVLARTRRTTDQVGALGRLIVKDLGSGDAEVRKEALGALSELRRELEGKDAPFRDADEGRGWWAARPESQGG